MSTTHDLPVSFDLIIPSMIAANGKQMIRQIAAQASAMIGIKERILAERIAEREKQNPSTMGDGIAVLHLPLGSLNEPLHIFVRLKNGIDMKAPDKKHVDLIAVLMTPEREGAAYLRTMAKLSRTLRNPQICARLRASSDEKEIRSVFGQTLVQRIAA